MHKHYPEGTVRSLLKTDEVTEATRRALTERLTQTFDTPQFFTESEYDLLKAVCLRLIPTDELTASVNVAGTIDQRLARKKGDGWRYDTMPPDGEAYKQGLAGVDESAKALFNKPFAELSDEQKDDLLTQVQQATAPGDTWKKLPADRFFEELLAETANNYYSHPLAQEEIGYVGMADVPGWHRIKLDQLENREPKELTD